ncbi:MFS transporter [Alienimonas sp. DA493]|uniref:MFS transporter n=1 Tax=Alienimonas sp. DA493 TaxID=3373605 RepID=UPI00375452E2
MTTDPPAAAPAPAPAADPALSDANRKRLFWACFIALITTAFGFIVRALVIDEWGDAYGLTGNQKGEIFGAGLWPFAISIILGSLFIDKVGYGTGMAFAFVCHVLSAVVTIFGPGMMGDADGAYWALYVGNVIVALGNGAVEAVINPVVATLFPREKTKWLNILHAGWPGGLVLGGIIVLGMDGLFGEYGADGELLVPVNWQYKVALIFLPTLVYGALMLTCKFPINERVAAGVSYREMLAELGWGGAFIVSSMIFLELTRVAGALLDTEIHAAVPWVLAALIAAGFGAYVRGAFGNPIVVAILLIMIPLATTELGTDSWITSLLEPVMKDVGIRAGWVLVYTSAIMMVLRFFAGPIVHRISPLGLLSACSAIAAVGLVLLSTADGAAMVLLAATIYGVGKTFFWPTTLGVTAEQSPRGGALTLNAVGGTGMLAVGTVGAVFLGYFADTNSVDELQETAPAVAETVTQPTTWVFGDYQAIDPTLVGDLPEAEAATVADAEGAGKQAALMDVALFPCLMLVAFLALLFYFKSRGGYAAVELTEGHGGKTDERDEELAGAVPGPVR